MILNVNSLEILLDLYKEDKISKEQAVQLIQDLYKPAEVHTYPYWPQVWYTTTPNVPGDFPEYKITCNTTER